FVRKYDADGNELWTRQFGAPSVQYGGGAAVASVAVDASGVYVVGGTTGILPGQSVAGPILGFADAFVRKYDANGNELWTHQFGGVDNLNDFATSVAVDASGVYVAGSVTGTLPGQTSAGGGDDAVVRKYDATGHE